MTFNDRRQAELPEGHFKSRDWFYQDRVRIAAALCSVAATSVHIGDTNRGVALAKDALDRWLSFVPKVETQESTQWVEKIAAEPRALAYAVLAKGAASAHPGEDRQKAAQYRDQLPPGKKKRYENIFTWCEILI